MSGYPICPLYIQGNSRCLVTQFIHYIFQVTVDASFQYFLRKSDLPLLHKAYDVYYKDVMVSSSIDALKVSTQS